MKLSLLISQIMPEAWEINTGLGNSQERPEFADGINQSVKYYSWSREEITWIYGVAVLTVSSITVRRRVSSMGRRLPWGRVPVVGIVGPVTLQVCCWSFQQEPLGIKFGRAGYGKSAVVRSYSIVCTSCCDNFLVCKYYLRWCTLAGARPWG